VIPSVILRAQEIVELEGLRLLVTTPQEWWRDPWRRAQRWWYGLSPTEQKELVQYACLIVCMILEALIKGVAR
jgi:hypothetical protein